MWYHSYAHSRDVQDLEGGRGRHGDSEVVDKIHEVGDGDVVIVEDWGEGAGEGGGGSSEGWEGELGN